MPSRAWARRNETITRQVLEVFVLCACFLFVLVLSSCFVTRRFMIYDSSVLRNTCPVPGAACHTVPCSPCRSKDAI